MSTLIAVTLTPLSASRRHGARKCKVASLLFALHSFDGGIHGGDLEYVHSLSPDSNSSSFGYCLFWVLFECLSTISGVPFSLKHFMLVVSTSLPSNMRSPTRLPCNN